jgi:hypothetical protein
MKNSARGEPVEPCELCMTMHESFRGLREFSGGYRSGKKLTAETRRALRGEFEIQISAYSVPLR